MRQHSWWFWIVVIIASAAVIIVVSLVVLHLLPEVWQRWAFLVPLAIGAALSFWADVFGIRSSRRGERETRELVTEQKKTREALEALLKAIEVKVLAALTEFVDGMAPEALEITIVTEDKFIQGQQEKLQAGRVDEVIKAVERHKVERVSEYSGLLVLQRDFEMALLCPS